MICATVAYRKKMGMFRMFFSLILDMISTSFDVATPYTNKVHIVSTYQRGLCRPGKKLALCSYSPPLPVRIVPHLLPQDRL